MKKSAVFALGLSLLLAACGAPEPTRAPAAPSAQAVSPTAAPTPTASPSPAPAQGLFLDFLEGRASARVGENFTCQLSYACVARDWLEEGYVDRCLLKEREELTLADLLEMTQESLMRECPDLAWQYAVLNTPSGRELLAVMLQHLNIYSGGDDSRAYFIFREEAGTLELTYARDSWVRSELELTADLVFIGYGSSGAGDNHAWMDRMDHEGLYEEIYRVETLYGPWVGMHYWDQSVGEYGWNGAVLALIDTPAGAFYTYWEEGEPPQEEKLSWLLAHLKEEGRASVEDSSAFFDRLCQEAGIADVTSFEGWLALEPEP